MFNFPCLDKLGLFCQSNQLQTLVLHSTYTRRCWWSLVMAHTYASGLLAVIHESIVSVTTFTLICRHLLYPKYTQEHITYNTLRHSQ